MLGRGQETPENHPLNVVRGFFYRLVRPKEQQRYLMTIKNLGSGMINFLFRVLLDNEPAVVLP